MTPAETNAATTAFASITQAPALWGFLHLLRNAEFLSDQPLDVQAADCCLGFNLERRSRQYCLGYLGQLWILAAHICSRRFNRYAAGHLLPVELKKWHVNMIQ